MFTGLLKKVLACILHPVLKNRIYTIKHGLGKGLKRKGGLGFLTRRNLTAEERFLSKLVLDGQTIYDIGAYVGITSMFFARSVGNTGKVIAFEPNPENCLQLQENLTLNNIQNVQLMKVGVGDRREKRILAVRDWESATGSMNIKAKSEIFREKGRKYQVEVYPLDDFIEQNNLATPDFVKIDVEGMEYEVLLGMRNTISEHKPSLFIEIHGTRARIGNIQKFIEFLTLQEYSIHHVESDQVILTRNAEVAKNGHLFCTSNSRD